MDARTSQYGLQILIDVEDPELDIVAVQGLGSHPERSWTWIAHTDKEKKEVQSGQRKDHVNWLKDLLPKDFPRAQISVFNYESRWWHEGRSQRTETCSRLMLRALQAQYQGRLSYRPIIFISHSFGGIVVQQAIIEALLNDDFKFVLDSIVGIVFLGTPNRGSTTTEMARNIAHVGKKIGFGTEDKILDDLLPNSATLLELRNNFIRWANKANIVINCMFEQHESSVGIRKQIIVTESSAGFDGHPPDLVNANHHTINKYWGLKDPSYVLVLGYLRNMLINMPKILEHRCNPLKIVQDDINVNDKEQLQCLQALYLTDPQADMRRIKQAKGKHTHGTCTWLVARDEFTSWVSSEDSQILHITGNAGIGKTIMSTFIVEELLEKSQTTEMTFAYYFCDNKDEKRNAASCIVRGLLLQLLRQRPSLFRYIINDFLIKGKRLFQDFYDMWSFFNAILLDDSIGDIYLLIDALDECDHKSCSEFLSSLEELQEELKAKKGSKVRTLITSRPYPRVLDNLTADCLLEMDSRKISADLSLYVNSKVDELAKKKRYSKALERDVRLVLLEKSGGTFLWVSLVAQELAKALRSDVRRKLENLPATLDQVYDGIISNIDRDHIEKAQIILKLIVAARRPLTIRELAIAMQVHFQQRETHPTRDEVDEATDAYLCCGGLLFISPPEEEDYTSGSRGHISDGVEYVPREAYENQPPFPNSEASTISSSGLTESEEYYNSTVNLVHQSVKEYLLNPEKSAKNQPLNLPFHFYEINFLIFQVCWRYMGVEDLDYGNAIVERSEQNFLSLNHRILELCREYHFLRYTFKEWLHHATLSKPYDLSEAFWQTTRFDRAANFRDFMVLEAVKHGLGEGLRLLLNQGAEVGGKDAEGNTTLIYAVIIESKEIVGLLLDRGADIEGKDEKGRRALVLAVLLKFKEMAGFLLDSGADIESKDREGYTSLMRTVPSESREMAAFLLDRGADIESKDREGHTSLMIAVASGFKKMADFLLNRGADIESKNREGHTSLMLAVPSESKEMAAFLLDRGADIESKNREGHTSLMIAVASGSKEMADFLLNRGADIESKDREGYTSLMCTIPSESKEMAAFLLDRGADIESKDREGHTSLMCAVTSGSKEMAGLFLNRGADIEAKTEEGHTALMLAVIIKSKEMAEFLLNRGADIEGKDEEGHTVLMQAVIMKSKEMAGFLLDRGADIEGKDEEGRTLLMLAVVLKSKEMAGFLLNRGADIKGKDKKGHTLLMLAVIISSKEMAGLLLDRGANIKGKDEKGLTLLMLAVIISSREMAGFLINRGADIEGKDEYGCTSLIWAVKRRSEEMVGFLLGQKAKIEAVNFEKKTVLFIAVDMGDSRIMEALLSAGANIMARDWRDKMPLEHAVQKFTQLKDHGSPLEFGSEDELEQIIVVLTEAQRKLNEKMEAEAVYFFEDEHLWQEEI